MYSLKSAIVKSRKQDGRWEEVPVGDSVIATLFQTYSAILLSITHPLYDHDLGLDLYVLYSTLGNSTLTINQWLVQNGNRTLPTVNKAYQIKTRYARYMDAFRAGYKVTPVDPKTAPDADLPVSERHWLFLNRPKTDMSLFAKSCMVSVNGFWHYIDGSKDGVWVKDGMRSCVQSNHNQIGILNFQDIASLKYVPITDEMIYRHLPNEPLGNRACIQLDEDISDKTIALVLGGYLHLLDHKSFYRVGTKQVMVDFRNIPMLQRFYESRPFLDFSSLGLQESSVNDSQIDVADFFSDVVIRKYLSLSQSFIVIIDNPNIYLDKEVMKTTKNLGLGVAFSDPDLPLFTGFGRNVVYWSKHECNQWTIDCAHLLTETRQFATKPASTLVCVSDSRLTTRIADMTEAYFLRIAADV